MLLASVSCQKKKRSTQRIKAGDTREQDSKAGKKLIRRIRATVVTV